MLAAPVVTVETLDEQLRGQLVELSGAAIALEGDTFARVPRREVLSIRFAPEGQGRGERHQASGRVVLTDGSRFDYDRFKILGNEISWRQADGATLQTPIESIRLWRLVPGETRGDADAEGPAADRLLVKNRSGEGVTPVEGVVLEVTAEGVLFALDGSGGEPVTAPWRRLAAVRFFRPADEPPRTATVVSLLGGSRFFTGAIALGPEDALAFGSESGVRGLVPLGRVAEIDLSAGRVHRAETLEMLRADWRPYFDGPTGRRGHALGESLTGGPLRLRFPDPRLPQGWPDIAESRAFDAGVAVRSRGELRLALPAGARRLKGWIGLDPETVRAGSAEVSVHAGERLLWAGAVDGGSRPAELNEPLHGEPTLTLRVDYGDNLDAGDHVHFADLRVIQ